MAYGSDDRIRLGTGNSVRHLIKSGSCDLDTSMCHTRYSKRYWIPLSIFHNETRSAAAKDDDRSPTIIGRDMQSMQWQWL